MNPTDRTPVSAPAGSVLLRLSAMSVAGTMLFLLANRFRAFDCWAVYLAAALTAWPLWLYRRDVSLFTRRLWLAGVTREDSTIRRWFWSGRITQALHAAAALVWATLLLALAALLQPLHWTVLAADVLILALVVAPVSRRLATQVSTEQLGTVARRWPLFALNLVVLTACFVLIDFFIAGAPDTRGMAWHRVAEQAFVAEGTAAGCPPAGWLTGTLAAIDRLAWHAAQQLIPSLPAPLLRLAAWGIVLVHAGLLAYLFTRLQLGVLTWLEYRRGGPGRRESPFNLAFLFTILLLALPYLYLALTPSPFDTTSLRQAGHAVVDWANPCRAGPLTTDSLPALLDSDLERARNAAQDSARHEVEVAVEKLFTGSVEPAVDRYLDWYFTVIGEYQRLAASIGGDFATLMRDRLQQYLFDDTGFAERLDAANAAIEAASRRRMAAAAGDLQQQISAALAAQPCRVESLDPGGFDQLGHDRMRASLAAGSGVAAATLTTKLLAQKAGATVAGKLAAKQGFKAAAGLAGKVAAKKGGSIVVSAAAATALCSPGGPLALVCGAVAGAVTWVAVDKAMVEIDETLFRDTMRRELLDALAESRAALVSELQARHVAIVEHAARTIGNSIDRVFIPVRDGL